MTPVYYCEENKVRNFELVVGDPSGEILNGDVPVRWCVTPSLVKEMEDAGMIDPHVLVMTYRKKNGHEMHRQLVPITDLMTYARFSKAGEMGISAWIINGAIGRKRLHEDFTARLVGEHRTSLISRYDGTPNESIGDISFAYCGVDVIIPDGVFGKEPSPWVKWFANLWHESRPVDECSFRRRMIFAFTLKWIPVLVFAMFIVAARIIIATFCASIGYLHITSNPKYLFRPFISTMLVPFNFDQRLKSHRFLVSRETLVDGWKHTQYFFFMIPFTPIIPIVLGILTFGILHDAGATAIVTSKILGVSVGILATLDILRVVGHWFSTNSRTSNFYKKLPANIGAMIAMIVVLCFSFAVVYALAPKAVFLNTLVFSAGIFGIRLVVVIFKQLLYPTLSKIFNAILDRIHFGSQETDYTEIRELLCPKDESNLIADYKLIPKERRSLRLWYLDTKNKICKPMQL